MPAKSFGSVKVFYPPLSRDELIARLRRGVNDLAAALPIRRVVLFGSWAQGRATAFSDIDVLVIYGGPQRPDAYQTVRDSIGLRGLEPHVYSEEQAEPIMPMLDRMTRGGVELL